MELYTHAGGSKEFAKKDVADYGQIEKSLMPDGLQNQLSTSDMRDLIAFLEAKKK